MSDGTVMEIDLLARLRDFARKFFGSDVFALLFLFSFGFSVRLFRIFDLDMWLDEVNTLTLAQKSFVEIWNFCKTDNFPPLFPWLLKLWGYIYPGEHGGRVLVALLGSLTPPAAYFLGKELKDKKFSWMLGMASVLSVPLIYWSQVIRMYSFFPFFACLSFVFYLRAIRKNDLKYWVLASIANSLGFYTFIFMSFGIISEALFLLWLFRRDFRRLIPPALAHIPAAAVISLWIIPALGRIQQVEQSFLWPGVSTLEMYKLVGFLGTGIDFRHDYLIASLLNLPFLAGFILCIPLWKRKPQLLALAVIFVSSILMVILISFLGQSIFHQRYFIFLVPVYLGFVLMGWSHVGVRSVRRMGLSVTFTAILISLTFYYVDYYESHGECYMRPYGDDKHYNGHPISQIAATAEGKIGKGEVIVHYSNPRIRTYSFFPAVYYHNRALPEYIYSKSEIPHYFGRQYLLPGDQIRSLHDLIPCPQGVWLISFDPIEAIFDPDSSARIPPTLSWISKENFPQELREAGFVPSERFRRAGVVAIHFKRNADQAIEGY